MKITCYTVCAQHVFNVLADFRTFLLVQNRLCKLVMCDQCQTMLNDMVVKGCQVGGGGSRLSFTFWPFWAINLCFWLKKSADWQLQNGSFYHKSWDLKRLCETLQRWLEVSDRLSVYRRRLKLLHIEYKDFLYCLQLVVQFPLSSVVVLWWSFALSLVTICTGNSCGVSTQ